MKEKQVTFEEKLNSLEAIVKSLEKGDVNLDDAINKYTDAMKLAKECSEKLKNAEEQINKILTDKGILEEFEVSE